MVKCGKEDARLIMHIFLAWTSRSIVVRHRKGAHFWREDGLSFEH
jgi:hypothetical protein